MKKQIRQMRKLQLKQQIIQNLDHLSLSALAHVHGASNGPECSRGNNICPEPH